MKNRLGLILFVGSLASVFLVGACGDDEETTCSELCDQIMECDEEVQASECVAQCEASAAAKEVAKCQADLACDASPEAYFECMEATVPSSCSDYCSKPCVIEQVEREACELLCAWSLSPEEQACLANVDGETCEGEQACVGDQEAWE